MTRASAEAQSSAQQRLLLALLVVGLFLLSTWGIYRGLTSRAPIVVWDLHPPWLGLRALFLAGSNPYGSEATLAIQYQMLGRPAALGEDQYGFVYPLYIMVLVGPLALLPLPLAQALWLSLLVTSLLIMVLIGTRAVGWPPRSWLLGLTAIFVLGYYSNLWAIVLGQISIVTGALVALSWWGVRSQRWTLAGVSLALSTIKPQVAFLFVPAVLAWAAYERRWRLAVAFLVTLGLLILLPVPWLPAWPLAWLGALRNYAGYTAFEPPLIMILRLPWLAVLMAVLLLAWTLYLWWHASDRLGPSFDWALSLLLIVSALIAPRTTHVNQSVLLLPLFFVFSRISRMGLIAAVEIALLVGLWAADLLTSAVTADLVHSAWQHRFISPILPILLLVPLLYLSPRPKGGSTRCIA